MFTKRNLSLNEKQRYLLMEFLKTNPLLVSGKFSTNFTQNDAKNKWIEITEILNSVPNGAMKDWRTWRKAWQDLKSRAKSKAYNLQNNVKTGNGYEPRFLSTSDEEILLLINYANSEDANENETEIEGQNQFEGMETVDWVIENSRESEDSAVSQNIEDGSTMEVKNLEDEITLVDDPLLASDNELLIINKQTLPKLYPINVPTSVNDEQRVETDNNISFQVPNSAQISSRKITIKKLAMKAKYYERKLALMERDVTAKEQIAVALSNLANDVSKDWIQQ